MITCGVPQGSVLGQLLFLLYINEFNNCACGVDFHLFADDSNLHCTHKNLECLEVNLNIQLNRVNEWLCANTLYLNIEKSNFVLFHPPQKKANFSMNLKICSKEIKQKKGIKYLGVLVDGHLNWKDHVCELSKKISRGISILLKLILKQVYHSIIYSFLTYAVMVWGNTYKTNIQPLVVLQKKLYEHYIF